MSGIKHFPLALFAFCATFAFTTAATATTVTLEGGVYAKMETSMGNMIIELYEELAPHTVESFVDLAEGKKKWQDPKTGKWQTGKPIYDGTIFHRVIKGFVAQGGDPAGTGSGIVGFSIPFEKSPKLKHDRPGRVAMARGDDKDSAGCQFYITFKPNPSLDSPPGYAVFGQVIYGMDTVRTIELAPTDPKSEEQSRPVTDIKIKKVTIIRIEKGKTAIVALDDKKEAGGNAPRKLNLTPDELRAAGFVLPPGGTTGRTKTETNYGK